jgi:hypothetical protein
MAGPPAFAGACSADHDGIGRLYCIRNDYFPVDPEQILVD